ETGAVDNVFYRPQHDYTRMLLDAMPRIDQPDREGHARPRPAPPLDARDLMKVENVKVYFPIRVGGSLLPRTKPLRAVDGVSFTLKEGETLGVVGESGCGKSTLARALIKLLPETAGTVIWCGRNLSDAEQRDIRSLRKE